MSLIFGGTGAVPDELVKPVGAMAAREMKVIPDEVGCVSLDLLSLCIGVEVSDGYGVGVHSPPLEILSRRISSARISSSVGTMIMECLIMF